MGERHQPLEIPEAWRPDAIAAATAAGPEPATEEDLARYVLLREAVQGMKAEMARLEEKACALAAQQGPGVLFCRAGATLVARDRLHLRWNDGADRDAFLRRLGAWDRASVYSPTRFRALYDADAALRAEVMPRVAEELRFDLRLRVRP